LKGHQPEVYEISERLGRKITDVVPGSKIPDEIIEHELKRIREKIQHVHMKHHLDKDDVLKLKNKYDFLVIATSAQKPIVIQVPGHERAILALDFLRRSKASQIKVGKRVVIIGAGNVGCDVAAEAARLGALNITLIDIQERASFGKERQSAEAAGARILWPRFTKAITDEGGETLSADTVIMSIDDQPDLSFLPDDVETERGFIVVDEQFQTSDPRIFAIGDTVKLGLLTEAIGAGRRAAATIDSLLTGEKITFELPQVDQTRVKMAYYDPRVLAFDDVSHCAEHCASCGVCRDCGLCETICPQSAISRNELEGEDYEYISDSDRCVGCGFCEGACPCGIWRLVENEPFENAQ
jgi:NADPH-dependent glutamate synthase beta subunit-like oxidoreductase/ferredoxin